MPHTTASTAVPPRRWWARLGVGVLAWSLCLGPAWPQRNALPALGEGEGLSLSAERQLGDRIVRELYRDPDHIEDALLDDYVQSLWAPLVQAAAARGELSDELRERFAWRILLSRDRSVNAFALPGGYLGVHLGLIAVVGSRDELASVLAHELSHVTQRHIARSIEAQGRMTPVLIGSLILGALAASKSPQATQALVVGGQAAAIQSQLSYSRDMEREADRIGFGVMTAAGYEGQSFVSMFEKLQQAARLNDNGAYPYLRSHPMTTERIADAQARQQLLPARSPAPLTPLHAMMAARAQVLVNPGVDAMRKLVAQAEPASLRIAPLARQAGHLYGAVLAALRLREPEQAQRHLAQLHALPGLDAPAQRVVRGLEAEVALAAGHAQAALRALQAEPKHAPLDRAARLQLAQIQVATQQPEMIRQAVQNLLRWTDQHPRDALAWLLLSSAYQAQGDELRAIRAQAESRFVQLDYPAAVDRFKAAQGLATEWTRSGRLDRAGQVEAAIIDARLRESEQLRREQALQR